jgi:hypothetical protein
MPANSNTYWGGPFNPLDRMSGSQTDTPAPSPEQASSIAGNISSIPQIAQLTAMINEITQNAQQSANVARIPGGAALEQTSSANISNALAGQLDPSVITQIGQRSAERGVSSGSPHGASTNAEYLRALGLTSLDLQNTGQSWLTQATGRNPAAPLFNPASMLLTPEQQAQIELEKERLVIARLAANRVPAHGVPSGFGGRNTSADQSRSMNPYSPFLPETGGRGGGAGTGSGYNWFDDLLFENASTPGIPSGPSFDYNWEDFEDYA